MADIFDTLNHLSRQMQDGGVNAIETEEKLRSFRKKLLIWRSQIENDNFVIFLLLDECVSRIEDESETGDTAMPEELKQVIATHLDELEKSFEGYFPDQPQYPAWLRQPLISTLQRQMSTINI